MLEFWGDNGPLMHQTETDAYIFKDWAFTEKNVCFLLFALLFQFFYSKLFIDFFRHILPQLPNCQVIITSFGWKRSEASQSPNCWSSSNVRRKKGEGVVVGDKGVVMEDDGEVLVRGLLLQDSST